MRCVTGSRSGSCAAKARGLVLSGEQADGLAHVTDGHDLSVVVGHAGTGKSAMLGVARQPGKRRAMRSGAWRCPASRRKIWKADRALRRAPLPAWSIAGDRAATGSRTRDVLVIDEAGMVGTRQLERVLSNAADAGAKVVLVGDPQQLQAIEAGAAFRSIHERHGGAEIGEVRRQRDDWQRNATRYLATGRTGHALQAYRSHGMVHEPRRASRRATI